MQIQKIQQNNNKPNDTQSFGIKPQKGLITYIKENKSSIDLAVLKRLEKLYKDPKTETVGIDYYHCSCDDREGFLLLSDSRYPIAKTSVNSNGVLIDTNDLRNQPNNLLNRVIDIAKNPKKLLKKVEEKVRPNHIERLEVSAELGKLESFMTDVKYQDKINSISIFEPGIFYDKGHPVPFSKVVTDSRISFNNGTCSIPKHFTENLKQVLDSQVNISGEHSPDIWGSLRSLKISVGDENRAANIFLQYPNNTFLNFAMKPTEFKGKLAALIEELKNPVVKAPEPQVIKQQPSRVKKAILDFKKFMSDSYKKFDEYLFLNAPAYRKGMQEKEKFETLLKDEVYGEKIKTLPFYNRNNPITLDALIQESERSTQFPGLRIKPNVSDNLRTLIDSNLYKDGAVSELHFNLYNGFSKIYLKHGDVEINAFNLGKNNVDFTTSPRKFKKQLIQLEKHLKDKIVEAKLKNDTIQKLESQQIK